MDKDEVFEYVSDQYGTEPEYLWASEPHSDSAVLRNPSGKWYGIVMNVKRDRLGLDGEQNVYVLNVKCDPVMIGSLRLKKGFLPAYHMNKTKWITILLDGTVSSDEIKTLISMSYELTAVKRKKKAKPDKN